MTLGQTHSREKPASVLLGERCQDQARASLRQALHARRRVLGPNVVMGLNGRFQENSADAFVDARNGGFLDSSR